MAFGPDSREDGSVMGIRFRCPNGHKLHVKAFQGGKRGICPQCGVKLTIPLESDPELVQDSKQPGEGDPSVSRPSASPDAVQSELPVAESSRNPSPPAKESLAPQASSGADPPLSLERIEPSGGESVTGSVSTSAESTAASVSESTDPITEAPHATWYVQPPSGGQYGPASGDIMRTWISEGRVTRDSLVWREGWADWKLAGPLFPGLVSGPSLMAEDGSIPVVPGGSTDSIAEQYRRRKSTKTALLVVVLLALACLVLFGTLIYVIKFMR